MPQRVQSGSNDHESTMEPPRKRGMIFKNAFGASDVEEDGDEDDEGDDEPGSRSVSKGKKKVPSNGVGINPADGQPGGFELVDKDGDSMRRKIRIEYITDKSRRHITFSKRKAGIMKKVGLAVWAERWGMCVADRTKRLSAHRRMNCRLLPGLRSCFWLSARLDSSIHLRRQSCSRLSPNPRGKI